MANFKKGDSLYNRPTHYSDIQTQHGEGEGIIRTHQIEQRISNSVIQDKLDMKKTPLSRLTAVKTNVIYFSQVVSGRNNFITNTGNISSINVNKSAYNKILDFTIICEGALNVSLDKDEARAGLVGDGNAKILPRTLKPLPNDFFVMMTLDKRNLYRVTEINKSSIENDSAYEITYRLEEENTNDKLNELQKLVVDTYQFVYTHVGTQFRTLFKADEYVALEKLESIYSKIGGLYNELFYDSDRNTYILKYRTVDIKDESGKSVNEIRMENAGLRDKENIQDSDIIDKPMLNPGDTWFNSKMYDRMLIEFITRNSLFFNVGNKVYYVSKLQEDLENLYSRTLYYAIENQTIKRLKLYYVTPSPHTRVTISSNMGLYGLVSLEPTNAESKMTLKMLPSILKKYLYWEGVDDRDSNIEYNSYESILDLICEVIGLYVNKREDLILSRLMVLSDYIDDFCLLSLRDQNQFYLFPILGYIIRKCMDRLSDENFSLAMYAQ